MIASEAESSDMIKFLRQSGSFILVLLVSWRACFAQHDSLHQWKNNPAEALPRIVTAGPEVNFRAALALEDLEAMAMGNNPTLPSRPALEETQVVTELPEIVKNPDVINLVL